MADCIFARRKAISLQRMQYAADVFTAGATRPRHKPYARLASLTDLENNVEEALASAWKG